MLKKILFIIVFTILPFSLKAEMPFWNRILFSDKAYAKNIQVKVYILTSDQAAYLLANPQNREPEQLIGGKLARTSNYLVVRVKNIGKKMRGAP